MKLLLLYLPYHSVLEIASDSGWYIIESRSTNSLDAPPITLSTTRLLRQPSSFVSSGAFEGLLPRTHHVPELHSSRLAIGGRTIVIGLPGRLS